MPNQNPSQEYGQLKDIVETADQNNDEIIDKKEKNDIRNKVSQLRDVLGGNDDIKTLALQSAIHDICAEYKGLNEGEIVEWVYEKETIKALAKGSALLKKLDKQISLLNKVKDKLVNADFMDFISPKNAFGFSGLLPGMEGKSFMERELNEIIKLSEKQKESQNKLELALKKMQNGAGSEALPNTPEGVFLKGILNGESKEQLQAGYDLQKAKEIIEIGPSDTMKALYVGYLKKAIDQNVNPNISKQAKNMMPKGLSDFRVNNIDWVNQWLSYDKLAMYATGSAILAKVGTVTALKGGLGLASAMSVVSCGGEEEDDSVDSSRDDDSSRLEKEDEIMDEDDENNVEYEHIRPDDNKEIEVDSLVKPEDNKEDKPDEDPEEEDPIEEEPIEEEPEEEDPIEKDPEEIEEILKPSTPELENCEIVVGPNTEEAFLHLTNIDTINTRFLEIKENDGNWVKLEDYTNESNDLEHSVEPPSFGEIRAVNQSEDGEENIYSDVVSFNVEIDETPPEDPVLTDDSDIMLDIEDVSFEKEITVSADTKEVRVYKDEELINTYIVGELKTFPLFVDISEIDNKTGEYLFTSVDKWGNESEGVGVNVEEKEIVNEAPAISNFEVGQNQIGIYDSTNISFDISDPNNDSLTWELRLENGLDGTLTSSQGICNQNGTICSGTVEGSGSINAILNSGDTTNALLKLKVTDSVGKTVEIEPYKIEVQ